MDCTRRDWLKAMMGGAVALSGLPFAYGEQVEKNKSRPNILLLVSEDHGMQLGCYGDKFVSTPNLDKLASEGVRFTQAYITQAGCSPSRASIMTGLYPHTNGQIGLATHALQMYKEDTPNLTTYLKSSGYRTGIIGKIHVNPESAFQFDMMAMNGSNFKNRQVREYAETAGTFFEESDDPFMLWISFPDAHTPYIAQQDGLPAKPLTGEDVEALPMFGVSSPETLKTTANYYNCIQRLDSAVGLVLDRLEASGKADNTLVIFLSDHGPQLPRCKMTIREGGTRVPMMMKWKGKISEAQVDDRLVSSLDILPTILKAAGLDSVPDPLQGQSLLDDSLRREHLFTEFNLHWPRTYYPGRAVRDARYKLVHNLLPDRENPLFDYYLSGKKPKTFTVEDLEKASPEVQAAYALFKNPPEFELYDLREDPWEFKNLIDDPAYTEVVTRLKERLAQWQEDTDDPLRHPDLLAKLTEENDATMATGKYIKKDLGEWEYMEYFQEEPEGQN